MKGMKQQDLLLREMLNGNFFPLERLAIDAGFVEKIDINSMPEAANYFEDLNRKREEGTLKWRLNNPYPAVYSWIPVAGENLTDLLKPYSKGFVRIRDVSEKSGTVEIAAGGIFDEEFVEEYRIPRTFHNGECGGSVYGYTIKQRDEMMKKPEWKKELLVKKGSQSISDSPFFFVSRAYGDLVQNLLLNSKRGRYLSHCGPVERKIAQLGFLISGVKFDRSGIKYLSNLAERRK